MWIFRNDAMLSVVENWDDPTLLLVRSRQHGENQATEEHQGRAKRL